MGMFLMITIVVCVIVLAFTLITYKEMTIDADKQLDVHIELKKRVNKIEQYAKPHKKEMWAATILGIIQDCDFRDVK